MKKIIVILALTITTGSCSSFKSGLTIPANQTFLLGELNDKDYSAKLTNKSNKAVIIKKIDKASAEVIQRFELNPNSNTKIYISKYETICFINENEKNIKVDVVLSKGVQGMRYINNK